MSIQGYSYQQKARLDTLLAEAVKKANEVSGKTARTDFTRDMNGLSIKDTNHFNRIDELKNVKTVLGEYNTKMDEMTGKDNVRHTALNSLDTNYGMKASKAVFDNTVLELQALNENHDMRLDELEKRFSTIQTDLYETVVQELDQKINSTEFEAMINQINVGQTGLAGDIAGLILTEEMLSGNATQNTLIATKADKAKFDTDVAGISSRHLDIEKRLLAVDQFFRIMAKTYKIYNKDTDVEQTYDANLKNISSDPTFNVIGRKKLVDSGVRSLFRNNITFTDYLVVNLTKFGYNTLTGSISVFNQVGDTIGSLTKEDVNPVTLNADVSLTNTTFDSIQVSQISMDNTPLYQSPIITAAIYAASVPDLTPINIIQTNLVIDSFINTSVTLENAIQGTGAITCTPALPIGITASISNNKLIITGQTNEVISTSRNYTLTVSNSVNSQSVTFSIKTIERIPTYTYNSSYTFTKNGTVNIAPVKTNGDAATSWSIVPSATLIGTGLSFNSSTGAITGTASNEMSSTSFTVTYGNSGGSKTVSFGITVNPRAPLYTYSPATVSVKVGDAVNITPTLSVGSYDTATIWSINPAVAAGTGLTFNTSTGVLSGTAAAVLDTTAYTVSYSNSAGSNTATFSLTIDSLLKGLAHNWAKYSSEQNIQAITSDSSDNIYTITNLDLISKTNKSGASMGSLNGSLYCGIVCSDNDNLFVNRNSSIQKLSTSLVSQGTYNMPANVNISSIATSSLNNSIYISGDSWDVTNPTFANVSVTGTYSRSSVFVMKLDNNLVPQWGRWIGYNCRIGTIAVDSADNAIVIVADVNTNYVSTLPEITNLYVGGGDSQAIKFNPSGVVTLNKRVYGSKKAAVDDTGNLYTSGHYVNAISNGGTVFGTKSSSSSQGMIFKYNSSFTGIWTIWTPTIGNIGNDIGTSLNVDKSTGDVYICTAIGGQNPNPSTAIKYSTNGTIIGSPKTLTSAGFIITGTALLDKSTQQYICTGTIYDKPFVWHGYAFSEFTNLNSTSGLNGDANTTYNSFIATFKQVSI